MSNANKIKSIESPQVIVVEASAGSGKTYCLAKRYLKLLIDPDLSYLPLRNILAITFTNKATIEMKDRILEFLKKISLNKFDSKEEEKDIMDLFISNKDKIRERSLLLMKEIIRHYNYFQVQTIDSFINTLLLGSAFSIDRSASFKIKRDYIWQLGYCLDLVIEQAAKDRDIFNFLEEFLEHYLFVENRTGWFPKSDIQNLMNFLFRLGNKYGKDFKLYPGNSKDVIKEKKYVYAKIKELSLSFPEGMSKTAKNSIENFLKNNDSIFEVRNLPTFFQKSKLPMNKAKKPPLAYQRKWRTVNKKIKELVELDAVVAYNPYIKFFRNMVDFFQQVSKEEDVVFLEELNQKASFLFGDGGVTVAELYYRLATRFRHYLIDEFQDTSVLQWQNLELMIEEGLSSGGSLFYVGDKKQAIYRFRGGEAELFDKIKQKFKHFNVSSLHLVKNWRSQKTIVEFNNKVFSPENLKRLLKLSGIEEELKSDPEAVADILNIFKDAKQEHDQKNNSGYVSVEYVKEKNQTERDEAVQGRVLGLIKDLKARFSYGDIAILVRDNSEVELVTSWLLEARCSVESEKTLNITQNPLIKELISVLKFLHSPLDDLHFAAFILGDIFCSATGMAKKDIVKFLLTTRKERLTSGSWSLYRIFRKEYSLIWKNYIDNLFKRVGFISTYELMINIYKQFEVINNFQDSHAFFMKFLELIKSKEEEYLGLGDFLEYLEDASDDDLYVNITHGDSVKVITIHKAKGLEFPVVIVPFLRVDIRPETGGKGTSSYVVSEDDDELGLMRITKNHLVYSPVLGKIYAQAFKKACIDELDNIYVALTRAKFELYIFIPQKSSSAKNKALFLVPEDIKKMGVKIKYPVVTSDKQSLLSIKPDIYCDWTEMLEGDFGSSRATKNKDQIREGNILHAMLSRINNYQGDKLQEAINSAAGFVKTKFNIKGDISVYHDKINRLLDNEKFKDIFCVSQGKVYCEKEVVNKFGDVKRIDRLIVGDGEVLVVDYKTKDISKAEYKEQMCEYISIIKDIYPGHRVKGCILSIDDGVKEEIEI